MRKLSAEVPNVFRLDPLFLSLSLALLSLPLPSASLAFAQQRVDFDKLEKIVVEELKETNTPGAAVAVVSGNQLLFAKGFGVANIESGTSVTPDTLFRIGSVTKMFTAAVLVTLAENGRLKLDEPVGKYVEGLNFKLSQVTAHQLLSHTAGMTDESPSDYGSHDDSGLAAYVRSLKEDHFFTEPARIFSYSNPGFDVAGFLIEQIDRRPYADQMSERLFKPLGMNSTTFRPTVAMTYPLSQGHHASGKAKPTVIRPFGDNVAGWPDGFMFSSVNDLARFTIAFMDSGRIDGKQVLPPAVIAKLSTPHADLHSRFGFEGGKYGYGLFVHDHRGVRVVWHAGLLPGFGALLQMVPAHRFAVIVLANRSSSLLNKTAEKAMELLLPLEAKRARKSEQALPVSGSEMSEYVGTYANKPESAEILVKQGKLILKRADGEFPITKIGNCRFSIIKSSESKAEEFVLVPGANGKAEYLHMDRHALRKVQEADDKKRTGPETRTDVKSED
jgi:CubicO group peptidase (beta-lactamase class C family)